ncbi:hypothetical protein EV198_1919 [Roseivirga ehrenbergii]|uniref:Uncharacterized protein n=1 Tax=Roseivirga ehrenbergii (strain DSM 102268 / JCM 13514 / KCTC 12282 / NCIMB 14502 / KMM 6017) TaxID=279360 RepID=A0A150XSH0_ROSEK|nr:hypothetical protein [Roseivirga ehrenbergii]KYG81709.1 hypothetical protein MB14_14105 [Roseivirga ehrenbergii]TCL10887.1 hypothetical protein EV198_1919 [Roseivirga ehrenbergii]
MQSRFIIGIFIFAILNSCKSGNQEDNQLLERAYQKQKEAIEMMEHLEQMLEQSNHQKKDSLSRIVEELEEGLFEIPGYSLELSGHERHEGHDHGHTKIELSEEEIYKVQEELVNQLNQIQLLLQNQ